MLRSAYLVRSQFSRRQTVEGLQRDKFHRDVVLLAIQNTRLMDQASMHVHSKFPSYSRGLGISN